MVAAAYDKLIMVLDSPNGKTNHHHPSHSTSPTVDFMSMNKIIFHLQEKNIIPVRLTPELGKLLLERINRSAGITEQWKAGAPKNNLFINYYLNLYTVPSTLGGLR